MCTGTDAGQAKALKPDLHLLKCLGCGSISGVGVVAAGNASEHEFILVLNFRRVAVEQDVQRRMLLCEGFFMVCGDCMT